MAGGGEGSGGGAMSKTLLQMKFMQKTAVKLQQEEVEEEMGALEEQWVVESLPEGYLQFASRNSLPSRASDLHETFEYSNSLSRLEDLEFGRASFMGMNPELEAVMKRRREEEKGEEEERPSVTDEELAKSSFARNVGRKFKTKKQRREEEEEEEEEKEEGSRQKKTRVLKKVRKFLKPKEYD